MGKIRYYVVCWLTLLSLYLPLDLPAQHNETHEWEHRKATKKPVPATSLQKKAEERMTKALALGDAVYFEDFQDGSKLSQFTFLDVDNFPVALDIADLFNESWVPLRDGVGEQDIFMGSTSWYTVPGKSDDWMITPAVNLPETGAQELSWYAWSYDPETPEAYEVRISTTGLAPADFLANPALYVTAAEAGEATRRKVDLTPYAGKKVYIAFRNVSEDKFVVAVDDIYIGKLVATDAAIISITPPVPKCDFTANETVKIVVKNDGNSDLGLTPISLLVNDELYTYEVPFIKAGEEVTVDIDNVNLLEPGSYLLTAFVALPDDELDVNNYATVQVNSRRSKRLDRNYTIDFEAGDQLSEMTFLNVDLGLDEEDTKKWRVYNDAQEHTNIAFSGVRYAAVGGTRNIPTNDWMITSCVELVAGQRYSVSFNYKAIYKDAKEKLALKLGTSNTPEDMTTTLIDLVEFSNTEYQLAGQVFTVPTTGIYYLGLHAYTSEDPDGNYSYDNGMIVDLLEVRKSYMQDVRALKIDSPVNSFYGCYSSEEQVVAQIQNTGEEALANVPVKLQVLHNNKELALVETTISEIAIGETRTITFAPQDLTQPGNYIIKVFTGFADDPYRFNDTAKVALYKPETLALPLKENFETTPSEEVPTGWQRGGFEVYRGVGKNDTRGMVGVVSYYDREVELYTPKLGPFTPNSIISFDYKLLNRVLEPHQMSLKDKIYVQASIDCGETFFNVDSVTSKTHLSSGEFAHYEAELDDLFRYSEAIIRITATADIPHDDAAMFVFVDNLQVREKATEDVRPVAYIQPEFDYSGCYAGRRSVSLLLKNIGTSSLGDVPVEVEVTGPIPQKLNAVLRGLALGEEVRFDVGDVDMSQTGTYTFKAYTQLETDGDLANDTLYTITRTVTAPVASPYNTGFEELRIGGLPEGWSGENFGANFGHGDDESAGIAALLHNEKGMEAPIKEAFVYTPKFSGVSGSNYISFNYRIVNSFDYPFNPTVLGLTDTLLVQASTDCGQTYQDVDIITASEHEVSIDFKRVSYSLTKLLGEMTGDIVFRITVKSEEEGIHYLVDIDNFYIGDMHEYDIALKSVAVSPTYKQVPIAHASEGVAISPVAWNKGLTDIEEATIKVEVAESSFEETTTVARLGAGKQVRSSDIIFRPTLKGTYNIKTSINIPERDGDLANNQFLHVLTVSDSTLAYEDGIVTSTYGNDDGSVVDRFAGQAFTLSAKDTVTSVTFWIGNITEPTEVEASIFGFYRDLPNTTLLGQSASLVVPVSGRNKWYTLSFRDDNGLGVVLEPDTYTMALRQNWGNMQLGMSADTYAPNTSFEGFGESWYEINATGIYKGSFLLRPNLANLKKSDPTGTPSELVGNTAVYPNPTRGHISIESPGSLITNVKVYDLYGKEVAGAASKLVLAQGKTTLDLRALNVGTYLLTVNTDKGQVIKKIVIQR